jgi:hypothetical protein
MLWIQLLTDHLVPYPTSLAKASVLPWSTFLPVHNKPHGRLRQNRKETKPLPIKLWSFPKHCSSYISLVSVWACGWSWSYIHTLGNGLFGIQIGHSQTLHTPSVRKKRIWAFLYFEIQDTGITAFISSCFCNKNCLLYAMLFMKLT